VAQQEVALGRLLVVHRLKEPDPGHQPYAHNTTHAQL
jgi:hypothetical protein